MQLRNPHWHAELIAHPSSQVQSDATLHKKGLTGVTAHMKVARFLVAASIAMLPGCQSASNTDSIATSIDELTNDPVAFDGARITLDACLNSSAHGVHIVDCAPHSKGGLLIFLAPPPHEHPGHERYEELFPTPIGRYRYSTRLTGIFKIGNPAPGDHWGSKYQIRFESDSGTTSYEP